MKGPFKTECIVSAAVFAILALFALTIPTSGDAGDSVTHYLYSHYAFNYPQFFLHHWAKPLFVLLSAPFSQVGFKGMLIFNCLCATLTALFSYYIAQSLQIKRPWLIFVFIFFSPLYFKLVLSGLTEYLFGLILVLGIYLNTREKHLTSAAIISLLPLVRSEGLLILGVFGLFFLWKRNYKGLALLLSGQVVYSLVGFFYYHDILWIFTKIPYANMGSPYGRGQLTDFLHRLNYVIEKPLFVLFGLGILSSLYFFVRRGFQKPMEERWFIVVGSFAAVFVGHAVFWWLGIFNSMGLPRVLISVVPLVAILAALGVETIADQLKNSRAQTLLIICIVTIVGVYPFTEREQGVVFNQHVFEVKETEGIDKEIVPFLKQRFPDYSKRLLYYSSPYLSVALHIDYFDPSCHREMQYVSIDSIPEGAILIWDDWFGKKEGGITIDYLQRYPAFQLIKTFEIQDKERTIEYRVLCYQKNHLF